MGRSDPASADDIQGLCRHGPGAVCCEIYMKVLYPVPLSRLAFICGIRDIRARIVSLVQVRAEKKSVRREVAADRSNVRRRRAGKDLKR